MTSLSIDMFRTALYRETRDVYDGLSANPYWFLMRKIGRFDSVKSFMVGWRRHFARDQEMVDGEGETVFAELDVNRATSQLRQDGLYRGLELPDWVVEEILQYAYQMPCYANGKPDLGLLYDERDRVASALESTLVVGDYFNTIECEPICRLVDDPMLLEIASRYLGGPAVHQGTRLRWSFAVDQSVWDQYRFNQTYHYDLDDYRAMKFFFYLTEVDEGAGPHICIKGSHQKKKWVYKILRGKHSDASIESYYGSDCIETIYGTSGYGFAEDTECMHKGVTPSAKDRLILIIEYALKDYGMQHDTMDKGKLRLAVRP